MTETTRASETAGDPKAAAPTRHSVGTVVDALADVVLTDLAGLTERIARDGIRPFVEAVERARSTHGELVGRLQADAQREIDWHRLVQYRRDVAAGVLGPLERQMKVSPGEGVSRACLDLLSKWDGTAAQFQDEMEAPSPDSLFAPLAGDTLRHKLGKAAARRRRWLRRFGRRLRSLTRSSLSSDAETRRIPVRLLVDYHCRVRLATPVGALHETLQQEIARSTSQLIQGMARCTNEILALEHEGDRADRHQPGALSQRWPSTPSQQEEERPADTESTGDRLLRVAESLQSALKLASSLEALAVGANGQLIQQASAALTEDLERAGTFLVRPRDRQCPLGSAAPIEQLRQRSASWAEWHTRAHNRLVLARELADLREDLTQSSERLLAETCNETLVPLFRVFDALRSELQRARDEAKRSLEGLSDRDQLATALRAFEESTSPALRRASGDSGAIVAATEALVEPGKLQWKLVRERVDRLPRDLFVHESDEPTADAINPNETAFPINLRAIAQQALEPPWPVLLRPPGTGLRKALVAAWGGPDQVLSIVQYNLAAAVEELVAGERTPSLMPDEAGAEAGREVTAQQMVSDALRRSVDVLDDLEGELRDPWDEFAATSVDALKDDWSVLVRRVRSEDARQEKWVGLQTGLSRSAERLALAARDSWSAASRSARTGGRAVYRWASRLVRRGRAAVGVAGGEPEELTRPGDIIHAGEARLREFPLVYRRLFSFDPLTETALFEGRPRDLVRVRRHFERWVARRGGGVGVLSGPVGSGRTTLLNVLERTVFEDCDVTRIAWKDRPSGESALAKSLGDALGIASAADVDFATLERHLLERAGGQTHAVCLIDDLEQLVLQVPGGTELIERLLIFLARTDSAIYWLVTMGREAWQYLEKTSGGAVGFLTSLPLSPLDRSLVEEIILSRHRRSGMDLRFVAGEKVPALMRQRLRRARTPEVAQGILQDAFFDGLFKASGQQIGMALFHWLQAAHVDEESDAIVVRPVEPLDSAFLSRLDLTRLFALRAFVLHRTLSLGELTRLLRVPEDEALLILEALAGHHLVELDPARKERGSAVGASPARFRLRRLMLRPVLSLLSSRRLIY